MERMVAQSNLLIFLRLLTIIRFRLLFLFWLIHVSFKLCTRGSAKKVLSKNDLQLHLICSSQTGHFIKRHFDFQS